MDSTLEIRPMRPGEEALWLACDPPAEGVQTALPGFVEELRCAGEDPACRLLALADGRCVGRLRLLLPHAGLCLLHSLAVPVASAWERVGLALIRSARERHAGRKIEALTWRRPAEAGFAALLEGEGFRVREEKLYVRRELADYRSPWPDPFRYASLADTGEAPFIETLAGVEAAPADRDPLEHARDGFDELLEMAGAALDPGAWRLALIEGRSAGLLLPQRFPDDPGEGTLYWIGLLPAWRGRGWGKTLHARGLEMLAEQGATRYLGSTALQNEPMRRVFAANGCREQGLRLTWSLSHAG